MVSILYFICAAKYDQLTKKSNAGVFEFLYFFASFWGQFGPNCTTWLLAGALWSLLLTLSQVVVVRGRTEAIARP